MCVCVCGCVLGCPNKLSLGFHALLGLNAASQFILSGCNLIGIASLTSRSIEADVLAAISLY
jgi:hypothetical protein